MVLEFLLIALVTIKILNGTAWEKMLTCMVIDLIIASPKILNVISYSMYNPYCEK
jgi:hypothetical protein